ncbi:MAG: DUF4097 family beta strand repeat-containing protein [Acidobacteriota bacterium]
MPALRSLAFLAAAPVLAVSVAHADPDWAKTYPVSAQPSLTVTTGDSSVQIASCGSCREIRIHVEWRDFHSYSFILSESQTGNHVEFSLREKMGFGVHLNLGNRRAPQVTVETPQAIDLQARTSDGALFVNGVSGNLQLRTSDGSITAANVSGALSLTSSDGSIQVRDASGTLESHSSDGSVQIAGKFTGIQVKGSDGAMDIALQPGSKLTRASSIQVSDGSVAIRLPRNLAADLEVHTGDGNVHCGLPLTMDGYNAAITGKKGLRGKLNGGGVPLTIRTQDGSVTINAL